MDRSSDISTPTITPVLAGWFSSGMIEPREDDVITLDGTPVDCLQVVGRLIESDIQSTKVFLKIEDGTGIVSFVVNKRVEEDLPRQLNGIDLSKKEQYLKMVFSPQVYKNKITNVVNKVETVVNFNAITYHLLSTVYSVRFRTEGNSVNLRYEQHLKDQNLRQKSTSTSNVLRESSGVNGSSNNGFNENENMKNNVMEALRQLKRNNMDSDFTFNQIKNQIGKKVDVNALRRSLANLQNNGLLFEEDGRFDLL
jgi:hypothetical protein